MLPAAETFVNRVRALFEGGGDEPKIWSTACEYLRDLLDDEDLKKHAETWPDSLSVEGKPGNLLFYEDPDYGFVLNALVKAPGLKTSVHDHGRSWTLYGVLEGGETVTRFDRIDDGLQVSEMADIRKAGSHEVVPGYIDFVPRGKSTKKQQRSANDWFHRSQSALRHVRPEQINPDTGTVDHDGPVQIPYELAW